MELKVLVDRLIDAASDAGAQQLGAIYRFLLRAFDGNKEAARSEFMRYLSGELSPTMVRFAREEIRETQVETKTAAMRELV